MQKQREQFMEEMEEQKNYESVRSQIEKDPAYDYNEPKVRDAMHDEYAPAAQVTLATDRVPEDILRRMRKVFSKHTVAEMRDWGRLLMKNYQLLHAIEKPMNLEYVKPFANTSDLVNKTPIIHADDAKTKKQEAKKM